MCLSTHEGTDKHTQKNKFRHIRTHICYFLLLLESFSHQC